MRNTSPEDDCIVRPADMDRTDCTFAGIVELARAGLPGMFNSGRKLFCHILRQNAGGQLVQEGVSHRYTMMTLLGLHRLECGGSSSPVRIGAVMDELTRDLGWIEFAGDLGLLLWLCAVVDPERIQTLPAKLDCKDVMTRYKDARQGSTTELAWILAGLSHAKLAGVSAIAGLDAWSAAVYGLLKQNQGPHGIFGHLAATGSLAGRLRGRAGSFADQVYPIYALAQFGQAYGDAGAIRRARDCAEAIVRLQGPQGEWWWHYDAASGGVSRPYPVYSVHQHGMAPMALFALEAAAGLDFSGAVERGLRWIAANNALDFDMRHAAGGLIWRCIYSNSQWPKIQEWLGLYFGLNQRPTLRNARVRYECRPYELGWALYALAPRCELGLGSGSAKIGGELGGNGLR